MNKLKIIDLTHTLSAAMPTWDGNCNFNLSLVLDYKDCTAPNIFRKHAFRNSLTGVGTHIDAPAHCIPGGKTVDFLLLEDLVTECVVIKNPDAKENFLYTPDFIEEFERKNGTIPENCFVIFYTGWDRYWDTPGKYRNGLSFPGIHEQTAKLLLERNVAGIGIDTLSPDPGVIDFPVHRAMLGAGKYLCENIANSKHLPETGAKVFIMPMKVKDGTEAPVRIIAIL